MWGVDPDSVHLRWHSPSGATDSMASGEVADPAPFSGSGCPSGKACRWTDAVLVRYTDTSAWIGKVALAFGSSPFTITGYLTYHEAPWYVEGWPALAKTGRSTGSRWVTSAVNYCYNFYPDSATYQSAGVTIRSNWAMLCQNSAALVSSSGDSGGPVYAYQPDGLTYLDGILHASSGATTIWSTAGGLLWDLDINLRPYP